jgi:hypothetical protein
MKQAKQRRCINCSAPMVSWDEARKSYARMIKRGLTPEQARSDRQAVANASPSPLWPVSEVSEVSDFSLRSLRSPTPLSRTSAEEKETE